MVAQPFRGGLALAFILQRRDAPPGPSISNERPRQVPQPDHHGPRDSRRKCVRAGPWRVSHCRRQPGTLGGDRRRDPAERRARGRDRPPSRTFAEGARAGRVLAQSAQLNGSTSGPGISMAKTHFASVDEYIASQPKAVQSVLTLVRRSIRKALPGAQEVISYQIPCCTNSTVEP